MSIAFLVLSLAIGLDTLPPTNVPRLSEKLANQGSIGKLVNQLGSRSFKEREAAEHALALAGGSALEALRLAAQANDPEVRRRAEKLSQQIRKRIETVHLLEPRRVRLLYQDIPVTQAVADFSKQAGFPIRLAGSPGELAERRITLDTGNTTFWDAFDRFCEKAGLAERVVARTAVPTQDFQFRRGGAQGRMVPSAPHRAQASASSEELLLVNGKPDPVPTFIEGAIRIRAVPAKGKAAASREEGLVLLEIRHQPNLAWLGVFDLSIDRAVDENGQSLSPVLPVGQQVAEALMPQRAVLWDAETGRPISDSRETPVRLKLGDKPAKALKELSGVLAARIRTPIQPVVAVDKILAAAGKTFQGQEGESLKVIDVSRAENGNTKLKLHLEEPMDNMPAWARRGRVVMRGNRIMVVRQGGVVVRPGMSPDPYGVNDSELTLLDANGQSLPSVEKTYTGMALGNNSTQMDVQLTFGFRPGAKEPVKLVYSARRTVLIEVPFTLQNVPLQ